MTKKRMIGIIEGLRAHDALMLAVWNGQQYPRLWLREWCGARGSVSIGTAECILEEILAGELRPSQRCLRPLQRHRCLPAPEHIETSFVEGWR